jgi:2-hydroxychromene-2-carboxylate isomerase
MGARTVPESAGRPVFYYDLASPYCYLVAEQIMHALEVVPEWQPVLAAELDGAGVPIDRREVERHARQLHLQRLRWPEPPVLESRPAMLAATYAKQIGRGVAFSLAAFRQAFAAGRDLGDTNTILIAGAACEMHPTALVQALGRASVARALLDATAAGRHAGVRSVPAIRAAGVLFEGLEGLPQAAKALRQADRALQP